MRKIVPLAVAGLLAAPYQSQAHSSRLFSRVGTPPLAAPDHNALLAVALTGKVVDEKGVGMPGVSVSVKGTSTGTVTDNDGNFKLDVPDASAVLVFSFVGYLSQEVPVGSQTTLSVKLAPDSKALDEVVVVGYGTQNRREVTGAVQTVNAQELQDIPVAQTTQKLQGKLAGVQVLQTTGRPGQGMQVRIRSQASISAGSDPLYVVDGFPIVTDISLINPDEIETITVLKDAASTSLYGSRAANGVVLITTKQAKNGQSSVGVNAYYGVQQVPQKGRPDMMNATEFAQFKKETYEDLGQPVPAAFQNPEQYGKGYDWYDAMFRTAAIQNYSVSLTAGKDKFSTSAVAGFFNQEGVVLNSNFRRFSLRLNSNYNITDKVRVGLNLAPSYTIDETPATDGRFFGSNGLLYNALLAWPTLAYRNPDGSLPLAVSVPGVTTFTQPNWYRSIQEIENKNTQTRILSNAYAEFEPIQGLLLKTTINLDLGSSLFNNFNPSTASIGFATPPPVTASAVRRNYHYYSWLNENTATYTKTIGDHTFDALVGYTLQRFHSDFDQVRATNFPDDRIRTIQSAINIDRPSTSNDIQEWSLLSYIGRLNYNYKGRYLLTGSVRRDGSSRFGVNNRSGVFPSVSAGWIVSDESFMPKINQLTFLKVRGSYGLTGNNNIGNYSQYATVNTNVNSIFGSTVANGASVTALSNPNLGWETTKQLDLGLDVGLFENRLSVTYDYYTKTTSDLLYSLAVPQESGFGNFLGNIGELKFWGHEIGINSKNLVGRFSWNTNFNIAFSDNKVLELSEGVDRIYGEGTITRVGQRIGQFWGMIQDGVYDNQEEYDNSPKAIASSVGTIKFVDVNGDGVLTYGGDNDDRTVIGNPFPKFIYGFTNNFSFANFDLSVVAAGSYGNDIMRRTDQGTTNLDGVFNVLKEVKDRWRSPENPGAGKYGTTKGNTSNDREWLGTRYVQSGSYLTIKNITLGYTVPVANLKPFRTIRVYGSVQQAFVFTNYGGVNPEVNVDANGNAASPLNQGQDFGTYPVPRTFTVGLNIGL
ncbi:TonB-dependent receptor [Hymenobacter sp.]|jgi:TonB-linked SusC/RagA family outer membrane protein|uniref:SusC/RagA family TonB-linked outer membrane protein n=1 Tax=Hymenobacter sp. TaxID=1898978 RepID=UPI002ED9D972